MILSPLLALVGGKFGDFFFFFLIGVRFGLFLITGKGKVMEERGLLGLFGRQEL